jgi:K+/H+ antiporter YhaU regulatory subunit KhtT
VEAAENENVPDVMDDTVKEGEPLTIKPEEMKKLIMQCMEAIEEVAKEVAVVKEEMAAYKTKMEKMSKSPAAPKLSTFNSEEVVPTSAFEARLAAINKLKEEASKKRKF